MQHTTAALVWFDLLSLVQIVVSPTAVSIIKERMLKGVFDVVIGSKRNAAEVVVLVPLKAEAREAPRSGRAAQSLEAQRRAAADAATTVIYAGVKAAVDQPAAAEEGRAAAGQGEQGEQAAGEGENYRGYAFAFEVRNNAATLSIDSR